MVFKISQYYTIVFYRKHEQHQEGAGVSATSEVRRSCQHHYVYGSLIHMVRIELLLQERYALRVHL